MGKPRLDDNVAVSSARRRFAALKQFGVVLVLLAAVAFFVFAPVLRAGPKTHSPVPRVWASSMKAAEDELRVRREDVVYEAWLVARHARTFIQAPRLIYQGEHCAPYENTVTYCIPMLTMGLLGIPARFVTEAPVAIYNSVLVVMLLLAGAGMFLLVKDWTGSALAGAVSSVTYAFNATVLENIHHPSVWDTSWTVFALLFARRLFENGRWVDTVGLAIAISLQVAADVYPTVTAAIVAVPIGISMACSYGLRAIKVSQVVMIGAAAILVAAAVYVPYIQTQRIEPQFHREAQIFALWGAYLPGGSLFVGLPCVVLCLAAMLPAASRSRVGASYDPRVALLVSASLAALASMGPYLSGPVSSAGRDTLLGTGNVGFYGLLQTVLPGLDAIRGAFRLGAGVVLCSAILAGFGAARLTSNRRWGGTIGAVLVAAAVGAVVWPAKLGLQPQRDWAAPEVASDSDAVSFFEELERRGNFGPILQLPIDAPGLRLSYFLAPRRVMESYYHRRRTSACFGSFLPQRRAALVEAAVELPANDAIYEISRMGFTTIVVEESRGIKGGLRDEFSRAAAAPGTPFSVVYDTTQRIAYAVSAPP